MPGRGQEGRLRGKILFSSSVGGMREQESWTPRRIKDGRETTASIKLLRLHWIVLRGGEALKRGHWNVMYGHLEALVCFMKCAQESTEAHSVAVRSEHCEYYER